MKGRINNKELRGLYIDADLLCINISLMISIPAFATLFIFLSELKLIPHTIVNEPTFSTIWISKLLSMSFIIYLVAAVCNKSLLLGHIWVSCNILLDHS